MEKWYRCVRQAGISHHFVVSGSLCQDDTVLRSVGLSELGDEWEYSYYSETAKATGKLNKRASVIYEVEADQDRENCGHAAVPFTETTGDYQDSNKGTKYLGKQATNTGSSLGTNVIFWPHHDCFKGNEHSLDLDPDNTGCVTHIRPTRGRVVQLMQASSATP